MFVIKIKYFVLSIEKARKLQGRSIFLLLFLSKCTFYVVSSLFLDFCHLDASIGRQIGLTYGHLALIRQDLTTNYDYWS